MKSQNKNTSSKDHSVCHQVVASEEFVVAFDSDDVTFTPAILESRSEHSKPSVGFNNPIFEQRFDRNETVEDAIESPFPKDLVTYLSWLDQYLIDVNNNHALIRFLKPVVTVSVGEGADQIAENADNFFLFLEQSIPEGFIVDDKYKPVLKRLINVLFQSGYLGEGVLPDIVDSVKKPVLKQNGATIAGTKNLAESSFLETTIVHETEVIVQSVSGRIGVYLSKLYEVMYGSEAAKNELDLDDESYSLLLSEVSALKSIVKLWVVQVLNIRFNELKEAWSETDFLSPIEKIVKFEDEIGPEETETLIAEFASIIFGIVKQYSNHEKDQYLRRFRSVIYDKLKHYSQSRRLVSMAKYFQDIQDFLFKEINAYENAIILNDVSSRLLSEARAQFDSEEVVFDSVCDGINLDHQFRELTKKYITLMHDFVYLLKNACLTHRSIKNIQRERGASISNGLRSALSAFSPLKKQASEKTLETLKRSTRVMSTSDLDRVILHQEAQKASVIPSESIRKRKKRLSGDSRMVVSSSCLTSILAEAKGESDLIETEASTQSLARDIARLRPLPTQPDVLFKIEDFREQMLNQYDPERKRISTGDIRDSQEVSRREAASGLNRNRRYSLDFVVLNAMRSNKLFKRVSKQIVQWYRSLRSTMMSFIKRLRVKQAASTSVSTETQIPKTPYNDFKPIGLPGVEGSTCGQIVRDVKKLNPSGNNPHRLMNVKNAKGGQVDLRASVEPSQPTIDQHPASTLVV